MRVVKVTPFLRWKDAERGEKIGKELARDLGGGGAGLLFAFYESADFSMD